MTFPHWVSRILFSEYKGVYFFLSLLRRFNVAIRPCWELAGISVGCSRSTQVQGTPPSFRGHADLGRVRLLLRRCGYSAMAQWLHAQDVVLWHALGFTRRLPKEGAFRKLLMALSPAHFESALHDWATYCLGIPNVQSALEAVAIDGKTLCGTLQQTLSSVTTSVTGQN